MFTAKTSKLVLSSATLVSLKSSVLVYLLHSPRTKSKAPKRTVTSELNPVINIRIKRIDLKSEIFPIVFCGCETGILNCNHLASVLEPSGNVTCVFLISVMLFCPTVIPGCISTLYS